MNWIAVEESGGMTRWINLDNVTEVRSGGAVWTSPAEPSQRRSWWRRMFGG